jgi:hypothetical protein
VKASAAELAFSTSRRQLAVGEWLFFQAGEVSH